MHEPRPFAAGAAAAAAEGPTGCRPSRAELEPLLTRRRRDSDAAPRLPSGGEPRGGSIFTTACAGIPPMASTPGRHAARVERRSRLQPGPSPGVCVSWGSASIRRDRRLSSRPRRALRRPGGRRRRNTLHRPSRLSEPQVRLGLRTARAPPHPTHPPTLLGAGDGGNRSGTLG